MKPFKFGVVNVVASASLGVKLNLSLVAEVFQNVKYMPRTFSGLVFKLENPKTTVLLFESGKLVCVGAKSECEAEKAALRVAELLGTVGFKVKKPRVKVQSMVASADLGYRLDLISLCKRAEIPASRLIYEPDQFPEPFTGWKIRT